MVWNNDLMQNLTAFEHHVFHTLGALERRTHDMALDLTKLTASAARAESAILKLTSLVEAQLAKNPDPAVQAQLDTITLALDNASATAEAEEAKATAAEAPAPTPTA